MRYLICLQSQPPSNGKKTLEAIVRNLDPFTEIVVEQMERAKSHRTMF
jgi:hypothetical protein